MWTCVATSPRVPHSVSPLYINEVIRNTTGKENKKDIDLFGA